MSLTFRFMSDDMVALRVAYANVRVRNNIVHNGIKRSETKRW